MAAKRVTGSAIDWAAFAARAPKQQKAEFIAFKSKCDSYLRRVATLPESLPKIHWDQYKTRITVSGMVEEFQKQYETLQIPYPADNYSDKITQAEKKEMESVKEFCEESDIRIVNFQKELTRWENMIPLTEMTMEEFAENVPEHAIDLDNPKLWPHDEPACQPGYIPPEGEVVEEHH